MVLLMLLPFAVAAAEAKLGIGLQIEAEAFALDPVVTKALVTSVEPDSLAAVAGIEKGDEITSIQGHPVQGSRASELKPRLAFGAGETRTFGIRHANGASFQATIRKPKE